jgi:hypothetical protein
MPANGAARLLVRVLLLVRQGGPGLVRDRLIQRWRRSRRRAHDRTNERRGSLGGG